MSQERRNRAYFDSREANRRLRADAYNNTNLAVLPKEKPELEQRPKQQPKEQEQPLIGIRRSVDFLMMTVLVMALAFTCYAAISYLSVMAQSVQLDKQITALTTSYESLAGANESKMEEIADNVDLNEVYEVAVGRLGMVYPNENQIITYDYAGDGYVRQYAAIPDAEKPAESTMMSIIDRLLSN